jgi:hypothetical protein
VFEEAASIDLRICGGNLGLALFLYLFLPYSCHPAI